MLELTTSVVAVGQPSATLTNDAVVVAQGLRTREEVGISRLVLTQQAGRARRAAELDALADSLMTYALEADSRRNPGAVRAVGALHESGMRNGEGVSYQGASARLFRIATEARDLAVRTVAVVALSEMVDKRIALNQLRRIAASDDPVAAEAVHVLWTLPSGPIILRQLYTDGVVRQPIAQRNLSIAAAGFGWGSPKR